MVLLFFGNQTKYFWLKSVHPRTFGPFKPGLLEMNDNIRNIRNIRNSNEIFLAEKCPTMNLWMKSI
jgi:hypothetical protein